MKILITIPHFFAARSETARHGSHRGSQRARRAAALEASLMQLRTLFGVRKAFAVNHVTQAFEPVTPAQSFDLDIVLVTVADHHLLDDIRMPADLYRHHVADIQPTHLGFACHDYIKESLGRYDYYGYLEDDLIIHDPLFFNKLHVFNMAVRDPVKLFLPHRYEIAIGESLELKSLVHKVYNDYCGTRQVFKDGNYKLNVLGRDITIERARQPHAGCFFLTDPQARHFADSGHFGWTGELLWGSPLDTAATLGMSKVFRTYKCDIHSLDFFELQHACPIILGQIQPSDSEIPAWRR